MDANVTNQIQNKHKGEFSTRILDDSKYRFASRKKCNYVPLITAHITSNIISLYDKNHHTDCNIHLGWKTVETWYLNGV